MEDWVVVVHCYRSEAPDGRFLGDSVLQLLYTHRPTEAEVLEQAEQVFPKPGRSYHIQEVVQRALEVQAVMPAPLRSNGARR